jgi:hypothetical protein
MNASRHVDLTQIPLPWVWVDEHAHAAIGGCSVNVLQLTGRHSGPPDAKNVLERSLPRK